jgi:hypothetical protein
VSTSTASLYASHFSGLPQSRFAPTGSDSSSPIKDELAMKKIAGFKILEKSQSNFCDYFIAKAVQAAI